LLELAIAVAITCMLAMWAADRLVRDVDDAVEHASGRWLLELRRALDSVLARHGDALAAGRVPTDESGQPVFADPASPSMAELKNAGHLPRAFPALGPGGMDLAIRVVRTGSCPGQACRLDALAYSRAPVVHAGSSAPDFTRIAGIVMATDGFGGSVSELAPGRLRGGAFDLPNPPFPGMAALPAGTVAVWAGAKAGAASNYLQPRDDRDPQFRGDVSAQGTVSATRRLEAGEHLKLGGIAAPETPCPENGLVARDAAGNVLSCVNGAWSVPGGFGGAFSLNTVSGCVSSQGASTANPRTGQCSCPRGFKPVGIAAGGVWDWTETGWTTGYVCVR
jgi:hypothetical protein